LLINSSLANIRLGLRNESIDKQMEKLMLEILKIVGISFFLLYAFTSATLAEDIPATSSEEEKSRVNERLDNRGERINERLDNRGERKADRIENRAERAEERGNEKRAERLENKADRVEERLDARGDRREERLDQRGDRKEERREKIFGKKDSKSSTDEAIEPVVTE
jgi:biopolymer transport protein ExbB/TolQ